MLVLVLALADSLVFSEVDVLAEVLALVDSSVLVLADSLVLALADSSVLVLAD